MLGQQSQYHGDMRYGAPPGALPSSFEPPYEGLQGRPWAAYPRQAVPELLRLDNGVVVKNPLIDGIDAYYQVTEPDAAVVLAANGQREVIFRANPAENLRGDLELFYLMSRHTGRYTLRGVIGGGYDRPLSNNPIPVNCIAGFGQAPHELSESIFIEAAAHIAWTMTDVSAAANTIRLTGFGRQFRNYDLVGMGREPLIAAFMSRATHAYYLTFDRPDNTLGGVQLAALETRAGATVDMTVPTDGDFVCYGVLDDSDGDYLVECFVGSGGQRIMNGQVPREHFAALSTAGGGLERRASGFPFRWPQPRYFQRGTTITFRIQNLVDAVNTIRLVFFGRKVYYNELGKQPVNVLGQQSSPRPVWSSGDGNWQALDPRARTHLMRGVPPQFIPPPVPSR